MSKLSIRKRIKADIHAALLFISKHHRLKHMLPKSYQRLLEIQYDWLIHKDIYVPLSEINDFCIKVAHKALSDGKEHIYLSLEPEDKTPSQTNSNVEEDK